MRLSEKTFQVLDALDRREISSQRQLADHSGISLGQVNYIIKSLLEKGLIKVDNFRKNPKKIGYVYFLTPKGIEAKSRMAVRFVIRKIKEYDEIRERITEKLIGVESPGISHAVFIGPPVVEDLVSQIIKEKNLNIVLVKSCPDQRELGGSETGGFDIVLLFDDNPEVMSDTAEIKIPGGKVVTLW